MYIIILLMINFIIFFVKLFLDNYFKVHYVILSIINNKEVYKNADLVFLKERVKE